MQNQNAHSWPWGQSPAPAFPAAQPILPTTFASTTVDQSPLLTNYQQIYGTSPAQPPAEYNQWTSAQFQQWQQWQQWQEKYQQWQAQYGKKYAESLAAMGQNPGVLIPGFSTALPAGAVKPVEPSPNPPLPSSAQPVPPPPPEEIKPPLPVSSVPVVKDGSEETAKESKDSLDELSEAEKIFDVQFKQWDSEFEEWKKQNQDHPDKVQYKEYEKKWEAWREQLLQRLKQMKKKRLEKANEVNKTVKADEPKETPVKSSDTDNSYRASLPQNSFGVRGNKEIDPSFVSNEVFHKNQGPLINNQDGPNPRFGNYENPTAEGKFNQRPRFGNHENFSPRRFEERNFGAVPRFPGDNFRGFEGQFGNDNRQCPPSKSRVPSLFDIQFEKPPSLKPKPWEKGDEFDKKPHESKPWGNSPWVNAPSPWMQPWELEKISQKPEPKPWERDGGQSENSPWLKDKRDLDRAELSGYVGNILAKLGNVNMVPHYLEKKIEEPPDKPFGDLENQIGKQMKEDIHKSENVSEVRSQDDQKQEPDRPEPGQFPPDNRNLDIDDRVGDKFRRDGRFAFGRDERRLPGDRRNFGFDDRFFNRGPFVRGGRDDRGFGGRFPREDVDERFGPPRNGRPGRGFDRFDRDESAGGGVFDRFGRHEQTKEPVWKPQVFDYSQGRPMRLADADDGFKISTIVDYSHGENKQTFDYSHGNGPKSKLEMKSFDYGHKLDVPTVIDYGHGVGSNSGKGGKDEGGEDVSKANTDCQPLMKRSRSPRGCRRSRSRSPHSRFKRNSVSPSFKNLASRNRDRVGRQPPRTERNCSEDKSSLSDGDVSKHSFTVTTVLVEDLICRPGRESRPNKLVFIMRGLPGSGKTYVTKLIKDKEVELGGDPPRILSLDDYFMTEVEKETVDSETGRKVKTKTLEYEYEAGVESHYRGSLVKAFKKTVSDGFFSFIIVDSVNEKTKDYEEMWSFAKQKGFQVYIAEMDNDVTICTGRNIHKRTEKEITDLANAWEPTPVHYLRLDVRSLLQSDAITEVEMEVVSDTELEKATVRECEEKREKEVRKTKDEDETKEDEEEDEPGVSAFVKSRWDQFENSEQNLDRLDGLKRRREGFQGTMEDYLQLPDDFDLDVQDSAPGKKRVRWADLEERKQQEKMRAIGFVVGQTDWSRMTDPTFGESALTKTKYI